jgi:hypothetical protein
LIFGIPLLSAPGKVTSSLSIQAKLRNNYIEDMMSIGSFEDSMIGVRCLEDSIIGGIDSSGFFRFP